MVVSISLKQFNSSLIKDIKIGENWKLCIQTLYFKGPYFYSVCLWYVNTKNYRINYTHLTFFWQKILVIAIE